MNQEDTWCAASLTASSRTIRAKEMARILGTDGEQVERGERVSSRSTNLRQLSVWSYDSSLGSSDTVGRHVDDVLRFAESKATELERLAAGCSDCLVGILVSFSADSGSVDFALAPDVLKRLGELGITLDLTSQFSIGIRGVTYAVTQYLATLVVSSPIVTGERIAEVLGTKASQQAEKGVPRLARGRVLSINNESFWALNATGGPSDSAEGQVEELLAFAEGKANVLAVMAGDCRVRLSVSFWTERGTGGFRLEPQTLRRLGDLRITLGVSSLYCGRVGGTD